MAGSSRPASQLAASLALGSTAGIQFASTEWQRVSGLVWVRTWAANSAPWPEVTKNSTLSPFSEGREALENGRCQAGWRQRSRRAMG